MELRSFSHVTLDVIGMRFHHTYEIVAEPPNAVLTRYVHHYENGEAVKKPEKTVTCSMDELLQLLQSCKIAAWDGFHGAHPKDVKDGDMFSLVAVINDDQTIQAEGSANYPEGYLDLVREMDRILSER